MEQTLLPDEVCYSVTVFTLCLETVQNVIQSWLLWVCCQQVQRPSIACKYRCITLSGDVIHPSHPALPVERALLWLRWMAGSFICRTFSSSSQLLSYDISQRLFWTNESTNLITLFSSFSYCLRACLLLCFPFPFFLCPALILQHVFDVEKQSLSQVVASSAAFVFAPFPLLLPLACPASTAESSLLAVWSILPSSTLTRQKSLGKTWQNIRKTTRKDL